VHAHGKDLDHGDKRLHRFGIEVVSRQPLHVQAAERVRMLLGDAAFDRARAEGRAHRLDELLATLEENWDLGYLGYAADRAQVPLMDAFLKR